MAREAALPAVLRRSDLRLRDAWRHSPSAFRLLRCHAEELIGLRSSRSGSRPLGRRQATSRRRTPTRE